MKFIIARTSSGEVINFMPVTVDVTVQPRDDSYPSKCDCRIVFVLSDSSIQELKRRRLISDPPPGNEMAGCVCLCNGRIAPEPMPVKIDRPIAFIDIESTGVDVVLDRIIEFSATVLNPDGTRRHWRMLFRPGIPIPAEATAIHGYTDEDVKDCPPFSLHAAKIHSALHGKDIGGYNVMRMDLAMLDEHFRRSGFKLDMSGVRVFDAAGVFFKKNPRRLADCIREYCGREHVDAHGALPDCDGSLDAFLGQLRRHDDLRSMSLDELSDFCISDDRGRRADLAGKLAYDDDGRLVYGFGKNKGVPVSDDVGYARWMLNCGNPPFPSSTCDLIRAELSGTGVL